MRIVIVNEKARVALDNRANKAHHYVRVQLRESSKRNSYRLFRKFLIFNDHSDHVAGLNPAGDVVN